MSSSSPKAGEAAHERASTRILLMAAALGCLGLLACVVGTHPAEVVPPRVSPVEEPRVRIVLVEETGELELETGSLAWQHANGQGPELTVGDGAPSGLPCRVTRGNTGISIAWPRLRMDFDAEEVWLRQPPLHDPGATPQPLAIDGRRYRGELQIRLLPAGTLRVVNHVGIEDYLAGVIGHEMPLSWSDPALHAQAIAARSYALANLRPGDDHDLKADTRSQVYRGLMGEDARARELVAATRGMVVTHQGELVCTYFHSTCGGDTVPASWIFAWVKQDTPPLLGARECTCQPSKYYRWEAEADLADPAKTWEWVLELPLREVRVDHWPRGGYARHLTFVDASGAETVVKAWDVRRTFGLRSYAFDAALDADGRRVRFSGRGWGHGVGMCQFGAEGFAKQGWDGTRILEHFYPGARVEPLGY